MFQSTKFSPQYNFNTSNQRRSLLRLATGGALVAVNSNLLAQFRVEVIGVGAVRIPISISSFNGDTQQMEVNKISSIISADLERSGQFNLIQSPQSMNGIARDEAFRPAINAWHQLGVDGLLTGSITRDNNGRYIIRCRLWDIARGLDLGGLGQIVQLSNIRLAAHKIADFVYEKFTGEKGVFSTRITYITRNSMGRYNLWIADADGYNAQSALSSGASIISPAWSPDGSKLAYVSFEKRKPVIFIHNIATGQRQLIANFKGSNSAPTWSPDGNMLAITLTVDGNSQIYILPTAGNGSPQRFLRSNGIDTEPCYSHDGRLIYFVSDRGGSPQIYRVGTTLGARIERITFTGSYNISPTVSPDGNFMAYITRIQGSLRLQLMNLGTGHIRSLTDTSMDESPAFSPNGRLLLYSTVQGGKESLMTTTLDGSIKTRLAGQSGDIREPSWSPFST